MRRILILISLGFIAAKSLKKCENRGFRRILLDEIVMPTLSTTSTKTSTRTPGRTFSAKQSGRITRSVYSTTSPLLFIDRISLYHSELASLSALRRLSHGIAKLGVGVS
jgi:hypothetical protein